MFVASVISFLLGTLYWAAWAVFITIQVQSALVDNVDIPLDARRVLANMAVSKLNIFLEWTSQPLVCHSTLTAREPH